MRGGYFFNALIEAFNPEPSPHAWGLHPVSIKTSTWNRAIPTCVGVTKALEDK